MVELPQMASTAKLVSERKVQRINLTGPAKAAIERASDRYDMTQEGLASRLYYWFGQQTEAVQRSVIGLGDPEAWERVLKEIKPLDRDHYMGGAKPTDAGANRGGERPASSGADGHSGSGSKPIIPKGGKRGAV